MAARQKFVSSDGDHVMLLNIYRAYKAVKGNKVQNNGGPQDWLGEGGSKATRYKTMGNLTKVRPLFTLSHRGSDNTTLLIVFK